MRARRLERSGYTRGLLTALLFLVGIAVGAAGLHITTPYLEKLEQSTAEGQPKQPPSPPPLTGKGRLEPLGGIVSVYGPSGDRVGKMKVQVGDKVDRNDPLFVLASRDDRAAERTLAQMRYEEALRLWWAVREAGNARLAEIDAEIRQSTAGKTEDLAALERQVEVRALQVTQAQRQWERMKNLTQAPLSVQEREQYQLNLAKVEADLFTARKELAKTQAKYEYGEQVARAKRRAAELEMQQGLERVPWMSAEQSYHIAERVYAATEIKSPIAGKVLRILTQEGEAIIGPQAVLQVADVSHIAVVAEVLVDQVERLRSMLENGAVPVSVSNEAVLGPEPLTGTLKKDDLNEKNISTVVGPSNFKPVFPGEAKDRRIVEVRVELTGGPLDTARQFLDLQADVRFGEQHP